MNNTALIFILFLAAASLDPFAKLSGCWENREAGQVYEEQWMQPGGEMMLGMSRTMKNGKVVTFEFVQIQAREGNLFYIASPSQQTKTEFKLTSFDNNVAVFENPEHDFPQKVVYKFLTEDSLEAWIEGTHNGKSSKIDFPMTRVKCPGGK